MTFTGRPRPQELDTTLFGLGLHLYRWANSRAPQVIHPKCSGLWFPPSQKTSPIPSSGSDQPWVMASACQYQTLSGRDAEGPCSLHSGVPLPLTLQGWRPTRKALYCLRSTQGYDFHWKQPGGLVSVAEKIKIKKCICPQLQNLGKEISYICWMQPLRA